MTPRASPSFLSLSSSVRVVSVYELLGLAFSAWVVLENRVVSLPSATAAVLGSFSVVRVASSVSRVVVEHRVFSLLNHFFLNYLAFRHLWFFRRSFLFLVLRLGRRLFRRSFFFLILRLSRGLFRRSFFVVLGRGHLLLMVLRRRSFFMVGRRRHFLLVVLRSRHFGLDHGLLLMGHSRVVVNMAYIVSGFRSDVLRIFKVLALMELRVLPVLLVALVVGLVADLESDQGHHLGSPAGRLAPNRHVHGLGLVDDDVALAGRQARAAETRGRADKVDLDAVVAGDDAAVGRGLVVDALERHFHGEGILAFSLLARVHPIVVPHHELVSAVDGLALGLDSDALDHLGLGGGDVVLVVGAVHGGQAAGIFSGHVPVFLEACGVGDRASGEAAVAGDVLADLLLLARLDLSLELLVDHEGHLGLDLRAFDLGLDLEVDHCVALSSVLLPLVGEGSGELGRQHEGEGDLELSSGRNRAFVEVLFVLEELVLLIFEADFLLLLDIALLTRSSLGLDGPQLTYLDVVNVREVDVFLALDLDLDSLAGLASVEDHDGTVDLVAGGVVRFV